MKSTIWLLIGLLSTSVLIGCDRNDARDAGDVIEDGVEGARDMGREAADAVKDATN